MKLVYVVSPRSKWLREKPHVWQIPRSTKWKVKWRNFFTYKCDTEFETEEEARRFARELLFGPHVFEICCGSVADCEHGSCQGEWMKECIVNAEQFWGEDEEVKA